MQFTTDNVISPHDNDASNIQNHEIYGKQRHIMQTMLMATHILGEPLNLLLPKRSDYITLQLRLTFDCRYVTNTWNNNSPQK